MALYCAIPDGKVTLRADLTQLHRLLAVVHKVHLDEARYHVAAAW